MTPAVSTGLATIATKFSGLEQLNLTIPTPEPTAHLRLGETSNAAFDPQNSSWCVQPGGSVQLNLHLPVLQGLTLILQPNLNAVSQVPQYSVTIQVNAEKFSVDFDPHSDPRSLVQSWYLSAVMLSAGDNLITLSLDGPTPLYLQAVYVMAFEMDQQLRSEWCWAAVTSSLSSFLTPQNELSQCQVVNQILKQKGGATGTVDCCQSGVTSPACNQPNSLGAVLKSNGWLQCYHPFHLPPDVIRNLINNGKPLPILIYWREANGFFGGGHYVVITGVGPDDPNDHGATLIAVEDPLNGPSLLPYSVLKNQYKGNGCWLYSYVLE
jgi:hypothetical protein